MIIIALAMIYCDSVKFWECFYVDRRRLFFFLFRRENFWTVLFLRRGRSIINGVLGRDF